MKEDPKSHFFRASLARRKLEYVAYHDEATNQLKNCLIVENLGIPELQKIQHTLNKAFEATIGEIRKQQLAEIKKNVSDDLAP